MAGFHIAIAVILAGFGIYSIMATFRNGSAECGGICSGGECLTRGCLDAPGHECAAVGRSLASPGRVIAARSR